MIKVLLVEDEPVLGKLVKEALESKQFSVHWIKDGLRAFEEYRSVQPDVCVLDVMLPLGDGFIIARQIRSHNETVPILFLTARSQTADVLKGYESGGNDYLKKPFSIEELVVRLKELIRRAPASKPATGTSVFKFGQSVFNRDTQTLSSAGKTYSLSYKESELLNELLAHRNQVMDRKETLLKLWKDDSVFHSNIMNVYITKIRKFLSEDTSVSVLNIRGLGYKLVIREADN